MRIALAHFRVGETDGVSLEMDKWKMQLEKWGTPAFILQVVKVLPIRLVISSRNFAIVIR